MTRYRTSRGAGSGSSVARGDVVISMPAVLLLAPGRTISPGRHPAGTGNGTRSIVERDAANVRAAVDRQRLAGDVRRRVADEEQDGARHLVGPAGSPERCAGSRCDRVDPRHL